MTAFPVICFAVKQWPNVKKKINSSEKINAFGMQLDGKKRFTNMIEGHLLQTVYENYKGVVFAI